MHRTCGMHEVDHDHKTLLSRHHRKDHLADLGINRSKTLKYILEKQNSQILTAGWGYGILVFILTRRWKLRFHKIKRISVRLVSTKENLAPSTKLLATIYINFFFFWTSKGWDYWACSCLWRWKWSLHLILGNIQYISE